MQNDKSQESPLAKGSPDAANQELVVTIAPLGPDQATINSVLNNLPQHPSVQALLQGAPHRVLSFALDAPITSDGKGAAAGPSNTYRASIYDYGKGQTLVINGQLDQPTAIDVSIRRDDQVPNSEEFAAAVGLLSQDATFSKALQEQQIQPYHPMPPLLEEQQHDGSSHRIVLVGLHPHDNAQSHEIVGVNMNTRNIVRFPGGAPAGTLAAGQTCGPGEAAQPSVTHGTPTGQARVTVSQGGTVLWSFIAVRPTASSGTKGSGIELLNVDYRGKRVLAQAHVPILNVRYDQDLCGPYRDWQWQECFFSATGTDVTPGFRLCTEPAQTMLDTETDGGNYYGVAVYVQGQEVVLVSQMQAGWYRYISEWRFSSDGTIRPRFGFSAAQNSCVCNLHHHHVYWRLHFDIGAAQKNIVQEYNDPPIADTLNWHNLLFEIRRLKDTDHQRRWQVKNSETGDGYTLIPGKNDGVADVDFGAGDVWVLRYHDTEVDDSQAGTTGNVSQLMANIDQFANGESVDQQDVVVWYAAHFTHDFNVESGHIVGPELVPIQQ